MVSRIWTRQAGTSCRVSALNPLHMPGSSHGLQLMRRKNNQAERHSVWQFPGSKFSGVALPGEMGWTTYAP